MKPVRTINCEVCDNCIYVGEGDFICDNFDIPVLVKEDWIPTKYYNNCLKCKKKKWRSSHGYIKRIKGFKK